MPRRSRPGERRGGRKKGTLNKKTPWCSIVVSELAKVPHLEPVELFLALMRSPQLPLDLRIHAAQQALLYLHTKPWARTTALQLKDGESQPRVKLRLKTEEDVALDVDWLGIGSVGAEKFDVDSFDDSSQRGAYCPRPGSCPRAAGLPSLGPKTYSRPLRSGESAVISKRAIIAIQ